MEQIQTPSKKWDKCLEIIKDNITREQFNASFAFVTLNRFEDGKLVLNVPSDWVKNLLEKNFVKLMRSTFTRVFGSNISLYYNVLKDKTNDISVPEYSDNSPKLNDTPQERDVRKTPDDTTAPQVQDLDSQLRPAYNFDNFIEGESNRLARSVGEAIAKNPAKTFNPFFVFGPSGVGKTHLVNAIGLRIKELHPNKRVLYLSAHLFTVQYTDAVRQNKVNDFIRFYQTIDTLILDDVQELSGKTATQNTFFHIFNHLQINGKQIILTADRPPMAIQDLTDRLLTRFKWGLQAEISKPTQTLRFNILNAKVNKEGLLIPSQIIKYISENIDDSVRDLEGILNSLIAHSICYNCDIDMKLVQKVMPGFVNVSEKNITIDDIKQAVCDHFNLKVATLDSRSRKQEISYARQVAMYLATELTEISNVQIGINIGGRNHATVIHAIKQIKDLIDTDEKTCQDINTIRDMIHLR